MADADIYGGEFPEEGYEGEDDMNTDNASVRPRQLCSALALPPAPRRPPPVAPVRRLHVHGTGAARALAPLAPAGARQGARDGGPPEGPACCLRSARARG